jgi:hypothetical protein
MMTVGASALYLNSCPGFVFSVQAGSIGLLICYSLFNVCCMIEVLGCVWMHVCVCVCEGCLLEQVATLCSSLFVAIDSPAIRQRPYIFWDLTLCSLTEVF